MDDMNLVNLEDLASVFEELKDIEDTEAELTPEEIESKRRYDEIIKKHREENK